MSEALIASSISFSSFRKFELELRGVQKTDEPNKPTKTDRTVAKFSVRFRFHFLKTDIFGFGFGARFFHPKLN